MTVNQGLLLDAINRLADAKINYRQAQVEVDEKREALQAAGDVAELAWRAIGAAEDELNDLIGEVVLYKVSVK